MGNGLLGRFRDASLGVPGMSGSARKVGARCIELLVS